MKLYDKINKMLTQTHISMHVPGHKNNTIGSMSNIDFRFDMTEIDGLDDLHEPEGILKELNQDLSRKYTGYRAQMMVNGTTNGILSTVFALKNNTNRFIIVDDAHKSIYHAVDLAGSNYINVRSHTLTTTDIHPNDVVILTYPAYSGETFDIKDIIDHVHKQGALVVTDEAHGAHFDISPVFPASSMRYGSDITIQSYHKMLPALTMASVIFTKSPRHYEKVMKYINYFETSSPSYLVMLSIERAHEFYKNYDPGVFFTRRRQLIETLKENDISVIEKPDPAKIVLTHQHFTPFELAVAFTGSHIHHEMVSDEGVLWCLPLFHMGDRYPFDTLLERLARLKLEKNPEFTNNIKLDILLNKICVRNIVPYPPGVPLVREGAEIKARHLDSIKHYMHNRVRIEGIKHNIQYYRNEGNQ